MLQTAVAGSATFRRTMFRHVIKIQRRQTDLIFETDGRGSLFISLTLENNHV